MSTHTKSSRISLDYVKTIGIVNNGFNGRGFANPYDLTTDDEGRIFVLNRCAPARASALRVGICTLNTWENSDAVTDPETANLPGL